MSHLANRRAPTLSKSMLYTQILSFVSAPEQTLFASSFLFSPTAPALSQGLVFPTATLRIDAAHRISTNSIITFSQLPAQAYLLYSFPLLKTCFPHTYQMQSRAWVPKDVCLLNITLKSLPLSPCWQIFLLY